MNKVSLEVEKMDEPLFSLNSSKLEKIFSTQNGSLSFSFSQDNKVMARTAKKKFIHEYSKYSVTNLNE